MITKIFNRMFRGLIKCGPRVFGDIQTRTCSDEHREYQCFRVKYLKLDPVPILDTRTSFTSVDRGGPELEW